MQRVGLDGDASHGELLLKLNRLASLVVASLLAFPALADGGVQHAAVDTSADGQVVAATTGLVVVWVVAVEETASAGAKFYLRCGTTTGGWVIIPVTLNSNESTDKPPPLPIPCDDGLFFDKVSGSTTVTVYYRQPG